MKYALMLSVLFSIQTQAATPPPSLVMEGEGVSCDVVYVETNPYTGETEPELTASEGYAFYHPQLSYTNGVLNISIMGQFDRCGWGYGSRAAWSIEAPASYDHFVVAQNQDIQNSVLAQASYFSLPSGEVAATVSLPVALPDVIGSSGELYLANAQGKWNEVGGYYVLSYAVDFKGNVLSQMEFRK